MNIEELVESTAELLADQSGYRWGTLSKGGKSTLRTCAKTILSQPGLLVEVEEKHNRHSYKKSVPHGYFRTCEYCGYESLETDHGTKIRPCVIKRIIPVAEALKGISK